MIKASLPVPTAPFKAAIRDIKAGVSGAIQRLRAKITKAGAALHSAANKKAATVSGNRYKEAKGGRESQGRQFKVCRELPRGISTMMEKLEVIGCVVASFTAVVSSIWNSI